MVFDIFKGKKVYVYFNEGRVNNTWVVVVLGLSDIGLLCMASNHKMSLIPWSSIKNIEEVEHGCSGAV